MTHQTVDATIEPTQDPSKRYRCRHIFIDGHRCGSPSLRGEHLCFYHHTSRGFAKEKRQRRTWTEFELPLIEDRSSLLAAVTEASLPPPTTTRVILSEASRSLIARGAVEGPAVACPSTQATKPQIASPEINTPNPAPALTAWYPNSCHVNEKRTPRPPHSAHRHQAAQRRRPRRRHAVDGLQLP